MATLAGGSFAIDSADDALRQLRMPVLLVIGDRDLGSIVSEQVAAQAAAAVPSLRAAPGGREPRHRRARFEGYMAELRAFLDDVTTG